MTAADTYNPQRSALLVEASYQTYVQFKNNGKFTVPAGYEQVAAFQAPELLFEDPRSPTSGEQKRRFLERWSESRFDLENSLQHFEPLFRKKSSAPQEISALVNELEVKAAAIRQTVANPAQWPFDCKDVYVGYALRSNDVSQNPHIVALRGTQTPYEWVIDATALQTDYNPIDPAWGKVHLGFYFFYRVFISLQVIEAAVENFAGGPVAVTGHSLGAALTVLASADLAALLEEFFSRVEMYNYAGPRVGDPTFAGFYNQKLPAAYRTVNVADLVPILPPREIFGGAFKHVGAKEWSYLWQTGDVGGNHAIETNYLPTVTEHPGAITDQPRPQPTSCICD